MEENYELDMPLLGIVMNVTDACNLKCHYCFTNPNPNIMTLDTGKQAVKWFLEENYRRVGNREISLAITFFGGEPTLFWDEFIVPIMKYSEDLANKEYPFFDVYFTITTNGQLLTEDRIKFFVERKGSFLLSVDGDRETQNLNRPRIDGGDSFDEIEKIIPSLLKYQPNVTFRSTIVPRTVHLLSHNYSYARKMGFVNYFCTPNAREEWSEESLAILKEEMTKICGLFLFDIIKGVSPLKFSTLTNLLWWTFNGYRKAGLDRCGIGTSSIGVSTEGKLIACQENSTYHDESDIFYIGDIYKGISQKRHQKLLDFFTVDRYYESVDKEMCKTCYGASFCQSSGCPSTNYFINGSPLIKPKVLCNWMSILSSCAGSLILNAAEKQSAEFINFLIDESGVK